MNADSTVSMEKCAEYSNELRGALDRLLSRLGGIERFVQPGQSVVIKPNLLSDHAPEQAVTTHPEVVRHLIRMVKARGASVSVADSPANVVKLERVWERTGFLALCKEENVPLINTGTIGTRTFNVNGTSLGIANVFLDADVIINVPKVKTHTLTVLTAAVKNMYGTVPGFQKSMMHKMFPTPSDFQKIITAVYDKVPPALSIADGILGMEGDGPSAGRPVRLGFLAASADAFALDVALCSILKIRPRSVPYLAPRLKNGKYAGLKTVGAEIGELVPKSFETPSTLRARLIPGGLVKLLGPLVWIRPSISDKCVSCGRCVKICPATALSMAMGQKPVLLDPTRCIGCCCCHEVCPERAIAMAQSPFLRLLRKGRAL